MWNPKEPMQTMPTDLLKIVAAFLGLKDLTNFGLVCKRFNKISNELTATLKSNPKSIYEINEIMEKKFPLFKKHFEYQEQIIIAFRNAPSEIDKINSEASPLIQTNIKSTGMRVSKNTVMILCLFGIGLILAGSVWVGIDKAEKNNDNILLQALVITMGAVCLLGAGYAMKRFYSNFKRLAFAQHAQKPTHQIIVPTEKQNYEPKIQNFFKKRAEFFNALSSEAKTEVIDEELQEDSKNILRHISEIYTWVNNDNALTQEEAEMMRFYGEKLNEFVATGDLNREELPKSILQIMDIYKTTTEKRVTVLPMDEETVNVSKNDLSV